MSDRIVAVLETMWGDKPGRAPHYFKISPQNYTGKRLYKLIGPENAHRLVVTNVCKELVTSPNHHGKPDPWWLRENLDRLKPRLILVCGRIAQRTFRYCDYIIDENETVCMYIPHPAARGEWSAARLRRTALQIARALGTTAPRMARQKPHT
jgi:uracil-DNA glycosylase